MAARQYSNKATPATLGGGISSSDTSLSLSTVAGLPASFPFTLVLEPDSTNAEAVTCTALAGTIATVTRGQDGTTAVAHAASSTVYHDHTARDFQEPQDHIAASTNVHGLSGGAAVVGTSQAQTLTNKVFNWLNNTVAMTKAQLNAALSDADVATLDGSETLTNKTLTSPTVNTPTVTSPTITGTGTATLATVAATTVVKSPETTGSSSRTTIPQAKLAFSSKTQALATNTATVVNFSGAGVSSASSSGDSFADATNSKLTFPIAGTYLIVAQASLDTAFTDSFVVDILNSGGAILARQKGYGGGTGSANNQVVLIGGFAAADFVQMQVTQRSGGSANLVGTSSLPGTYFSAVYISPSTATL